MVDEQEQHWIERAKEGDSAAISHLYQTHKEKVYKFVYFRVGSSADAEDLFQEIMLAAFDSLVRFRGEVSFLHWCYQIARNKVAYFWRQKAQRYTSELDEDSAGFEEEWTQDDEVVNEDELFKEIEGTREKIMKVLDKLPENYATVLKLRFFEGKTFPEVAEIMQVTLGNAKVLQNRALKKAAQVYATLH